MKVIEISACRPGYDGEKGCPAEYDSHCMLGFNIDSASEGIPNQCPLRKSCILLQLKAEILMETTNA